MKVKFNGADPDGLSAIQPEIYRERFDRNEVLLAIRSMGHFSLVGYYYRFIRKIEDILDFDNLNKPCTSYVRVVQPVLT